MAASFSATDVLQWLNVLEGDSEGIEMATVRFRSLDDALIAVASYEEKTNTRFCGYKATKNFGLHKNMHDELPGRTIHFELRYVPKVCYDGIPFVEFGRKTLDCHRGRDRHVASKIRAGEVPRTARPYNQKKGPKKIDCPAQISMREIMIFPEYKVKADTQYHRRDASKRLKAAFVEGVAQGIILIVVNFPTSVDHHHYCLTQAVGMDSVVDSRILQYIQDLMCAGIVSISDIHQHVHRYVKQDLLCGVKLPTRPNKQYFPTKRDIKKLIYQVKRRNRMNGHNDVIIKQDIDQNNGDLIFKQEAVEELVIYDYVTEITEETPPRRIEGSPPPSGRNTSDKIASDCRHLLQQISDLTFAPQELHLMMDVKNSLKSVLDKLKNSSPQALGGSQQIPQLCKQTIHLNATEAQPVKTATNIHTFISEDFETNYEIISETESPGKRVSFVLQSGAPSINNSLYPHDTSSLT